MVNNNVNREILHFVMKSCAREVTLFVQFFYYHLILLHCLVLIFLFVGPCLWRYRSECLAGSINSLYVSFIYILYYIYLIISK